MRDHETILLHLRTYRDPELVPTIRSALAHAMHSSLVHFGICRQFHPNDGFDNLDEYWADPRFHVVDVPY
jgi:hypothetical protein